MLDNTAPDTMRVILGPLATDLPFMIRNLNALLRGVGVQVREQLGLETGSIGVLMMIWVNPGISQNDLSASLAMKKPSVTRLVKLLEAEGLLERQRVSGDRRMNAITLTSAGHQMVATIRRETVAMNDAITKTIAAADLDTFFRVLETLHATLKARQPATSI